MGRACRPRGGDRFVANMAGVDGVGGVLTVVGRDLGDAGFGRDRGEVEILSYGVDDHWGSSVAHLPTTVIVVVWFMVGSSLLGR